MHLFQAPTFSPNVLCVWLTLTGLISSLLTDSSVLSFHSTPTSSSTYPGATQFPFVHSGRTTLLCGRSMLLRLMSHSLPPHPVVHVR